LDVVALLDDVPNVDADPQDDPALGRPVQVELVERLLDARGALDRVKRAPELDQERVPDGLYLLPVALAQYPFERSIKEI